MDYLRKFMSEQDNFTCSGLGKPRKNSAMTNLRHTFVVRSIEAALAAAKLREELLLAYIRNYRYLASTNAFTPNFWRFWKPAGDRF